MGRSGKLFAVKYSSIKISEDYLAYLARTRIALEEERVRRDAMPKMPYGEASFSEVAEKYGKIMYRYELVTKGSPSELGTSVEGAKHTLEVVISGELV